jgi:hypothetical protein
LAEAEGKPLLDKYATYVFGACFESPKLEEKCRPYVVANFGKFLSLPETKTYFDLLIKWCPAKVLPLVQDAFKSVEKEIKVDPTFVSN